jgi:hypothetical protein
MRTQDTIQQIPASETSYAVLDQPDGGPDAGFCTNLFPDTRRPGPHPIILHRLNQGIRQL